MEILTPEWIMSEEGKDWLRTAMLRAIGKAPPLPTPPKPRATADPPVLLKLPDVVAPDIAA